MKAKIYRGTKEIGGTCLELTADNGKILWIDLGAPLDKKNPNVDYAKNKVDALLISHSHQDHWGLMEEVGIEVPICIGQLTFDLISAPRIFLNKESLSGNYKIIHAWKSIIVADTFKVTPYLTDHSTPEAFAFLIEADGKRIFYSGDFRATGRKRILFEKMIENPPPNIDLLFMEGTMMERTNHIYETEKDVEEAMLSIIKAQKNVSFVISSAQNIDRFVSLYRACKRADKYVVVDVYNAVVLDMARKQSEGIPGIDWKEVKVYDKESQLAKLKDKSYDEFKSRVEKNKVGSAIFKRPSDFVYFLRCPNKYFVDALRPHGTINVIYSQWVGYLKEEFKTDYTERYNQLKNDSDIAFEVIHTSGHATVPDLLKFAKAINPKKIVPIHTGFPETFKREFEKEGFKNINLWEDGKDYSL
jgi:ribonuclease J